MTMFHADQNKSCAETAKHVSLQLCGDDFSENGGLLDTVVRNWTEAEETVIAAGYEVIKESDGGSWDYYDAEDGPGVCGYEQDGMGVYIITVAA